MNFISYIEFAKVAFDFLQFQAEFRIKFNLQLDQTKIK